MPDVRQSPVRISHLDTRSIQENVHHRLKHRLDNGVESFIFLALEDKRYVNVRIGGQFAPAVSAGGDDRQLGHGTGRVSRTEKSEFEQTPNGGVGHLRVALKYCRTDLGQCFPSIYFVAACPDECADLT